MSCAIGYHLISLFFIRLIDNVKKNGVVTKNQSILHSKAVLMFPTVNALVRATAWVKGKNIWATVCTTTGRVVMEKNVPLRMNIGVMKRNDG